MTRNDEVPQEVGEALRKLRWGAERHITREYRTVTLGEHECRLLLAKLEAAEGEVARLREDARRYQFLRLRMIAEELNDDFAAATALQLVGPVGKRPADCDYMEGLDAAIDAALQEHTP